MIKKLSFIIGLTLAFMGAYNLAHAQTAPYVTPTQITAQNIASSTLDGSGCYEDVEAQTGNPGGDGGQPNDVQFFYPASTTTETNNNYVVNVPCSPEAGIFWMNYTTWQQDQSLPVIPPLGLYTAVFYDNTWNGGPGTDQCATDLTNVQSVDLPTLKSDCSGDVSAYSISYIPFVVTFQGVYPQNQVTATQNVSQEVLNEVVALPVYEMQNYETPLVGMGIILALCGAIFGFLNWFGIL